MHSRKGRTLGFTLLELLLIIAILGTLLGVGYMSLRRPAIRTYTEEVRALMQQARHEAIKRNRPVLIEWSAVDAAFLSSTAEIGNLCSSDELLANASAADYGNLSVTFPEGAVSMLWLPNGQARDCSLGSFPSLIATVSDGSTSRDILVSISGRVTIE